MDVITAPICHFSRPDGVRLAYRFHPGEGPLVLFLPGYMSDMDGGKAQAVFAHLAAQGRACLLFDYSGCGSSEGAFEDGTLTIWRDDVLMLVDRLWQGAIMPVGSSMGGWLALLVALERKDRTVGLVGIAAAPDFTEWGFSDEDKQRLRCEGRIVEPSEYGGARYVTTLGFWQSGQDNRLLDGEIALDCPVRLFHGQQDDVVPWTIAMQLAERLRSSDVQTLLVKDGDHRLSRETDITALLRMIDAMLEAA